MRSHFGIKLFSLYRKTGYFWNSYVFCRSKDGKKWCCCAKVDEGSFRKMYFVPFLYNRYTSEKLFRYLQENDKDTCSRARANWLHLSKSWKKEPL